jgi:hypothetical protein
MHSIGKLSDSATYLQNLPRRLKQLKEAWKVTHSGFVVNAPLIPMDGA